MNIYETKIKIHDTDAAGMLFFTNQLRMVHDAYESLLESIGFDSRILIKEKDFLLPIVHIESDYKLPLSVGDPLQILTKVAKIGTTSFALSYILLNSSKETVGTAQTVHVSVNKETHTKIPLPDDLRAKLQALK